MAILNSKYFGPNANYLIFYFVNGCFLCFFVPISGGVLIFPFSFSEHHQYVPLPRGRSSPAL